MRLTACCSLALFVAATTLTAQQAAPGNMPGMVHGTPATAGELKPMPGMAGGAAAQAGGMQHGGMNMDEKATPIADGGIFVPGWQGKVDDGAAKQGQTEKDSKFVKEGDGFHITTGPAITYFNPSMKATGDYTVSATFNEPKYMNRNSHPHPYGIVIAGSGLGTDAPSELYCAAYGNGRFIVRGFSPAPFQLNGRGEANDAVHKAAGPGEPVTQKIAMQVKGDKVSCMINDVTVGSYDKSAVVTDGKLKTLDGVYGIRFAHNTDATVTGFKMTKN